MTHKKLTILSPIILSAALLTGCSHGGVKLPWYLSSFGAFKVKMTGVSTSEELLKINKYVTPNIYHEEIRIGTKISASLLGVTESSTETQTISIDRNGGNKMQETMVSDGEIVDKSMMLTTETSEGTKTYVHDGEGWEETEEADKNMFNPLEITAFPDSAMLTGNNQYYFITIPGEDFFTSDMAGTVESSIEDFADGNEQIKKATEDIFGNAEAVFTYNKDTFLLEKAELKGIQGDIPITSDVSSDLNFTLSLEMHVEADYSKYGEVPEIDVVAELKDNPFVEDVVTVY